MAVFSPSSIFYSPRKLVSTIAGLCVVLTPHWGPLYFIGVAICNALLSKILKVIIRQPRPAECTKSKKSYGMPSSHAQTLFFFLAVMCRVLLSSDGDGGDSSGSGSGNVTSAPVHERPHVLAVPVDGSAISVSAMIDRIHLPMWVRVASCVLMAMYALKSVISRVQLKLHSTSQTLVGIAVGGAMGSFSHIYRYTICDLFSQLRHVNGADGTAAGGSAAMAISAAQYGPVPMWVRVVSVLGGALVLYPANMVAIARYVWGCTGGALLLLLSGSSSSSAGDDGDKKKQ